MSQIPPQNTGLRHLDKRTRDWAVGDISGIKYEVVNQSGKWNPYKSPSENQRGVKFETMGCTNWSANNILECQLNYRINHGLLSGGDYTHEQNLRWLDDNGYIQNGKVLLSNRWAMIQSGTTKQGNYLVIAAGIYDKVGFIPKSKIDDDPNNFNTWEEYMTKPQDWRMLEKLGLEARNRFQTLYEYVYTDNPTDSIYEFPFYTIEQEIKQAPLHIATATCPTWHTGYVQACSLNRPTHATAMLESMEDLSRLIEDHYQPYEKILAKDYYIPFVLKIVIKPREKTMSELSKEAQRILRDWQMEYVIASPSGRIALIKGEELQVAPELPKDATEADKAVHRTALMGMVKLAKGITDELFDEIPHRPF